MSTRVCVKQVPKTFTEEQIRRHFAARGDVTDVKLLRTRYDWTSATRLRTAPPAPADALAATLWAPAL